MPLFGNVTIPGAPDMDNIARLDRLPIPQLNRMSRYGMAIDRQHFWNLDSEFTSELAELQYLISSYIPPDRLLDFSAKATDFQTEFGDASLNPRSAEQVGKLLFDILNVGSKKPLKMTKSGKRLSTGKKQLETIRMEHPVVPLLLRFSELSKLKSTYCTLPAKARFHPAGDGCPVCGLDHWVETWRVHGTFGTTRAETGRINHKNPNLGNVSTRTTDGQRVQAGFIATPGTKLVVRDLSQIELRVLTHIANCLAMISAYINGEDQHDKTARAVFKLPDDVKPDKINHRMAAKRVGFGIMNGSTEKGLYMQLVMDYGANNIPVPDWLTEEWCKWFIAEFLKAYPEILEYFERQWYRVRRYGIVWDSFGRIRRVPEIRSTHSWKRGEGLRNAQNMPVTSMAAGQLKLGMARSEVGLLEWLEAGVWCWPLLSVHDSLMVEVQEDMADEMNGMLGEAMDNCMRDVDTGEHCFRVPITSDGHSMDVWEK